MSNKIHLGDLVLLRLHRVIPNVCAMEVLCWNKSEFAKLKFHDVPDGAKECASLKGKD